MYTPAHSLYSGHSFASTTVNDSKYAASSDTIRTFSVQPGITATITPVSNGGDRSSFEVICYQKLKKVETYTVDLTKNPAVTGTGLIEALFDTDQIKQEAELYQIELRGHDRRDERQFHEAWDPTSVALCHRALPKIVELDISTLPTAGKKKSKHIKGTSQASVPRESAPSRNGFNFAEAEVAQKKPWFVCC
jgi:hypothetical protein